MRTPNKERLRMWVAALRSGEYTQGQEVLHHNDTDTWCCLGVACDVARKNGLTLETEIADSGVEVFDECHEYLPGSVQQWFGLPKCNPEFSETPASEWNDDREASFDEIADNIEIEYQLIA